MKYCYTLCAAVVVLSILLNLSGGLPEAVAQNVDFPDANLAAAVRDALDLGATDPIPQTDLAGLTYLTVFDAGISNLTGLEQATGLTTLWLGFNEISDISVLSGLTNLMDLALDGNEISDISALSGLTNLTSLGLSSNRISNISALSGLTNLTSLWLQRNRISDISALSGLTNLTLLSLFSNRISDISALSGLTNLMDLGISNNEISDISVLSGLTNLTLLSLFSNRISDISVLSGLTNLTELYLSSNEISDISALSDLTNLTELYLSSNEISDISALSDLTNLTELYLSSNRISDISALSGLTNIEWLDISDNEIRDITPLSTLSSLTTLFIDQEVNKNNPGLLARILPANVQIRFRLRSRQTTTAATAVTPTTVAAKKRVKQCGLGWAPQSQSPPQLEQPKVMIYALEFELNQNAYTCSAIEIRTGDPTISHLDGWQLYLGTLYNPSYIPIELTQENSQITDNVLRLTPEMFGQQTFACSNVNMLGFPLPSVHYVLKNESNVTIDRAYSCYMFGQNAYIQVNGEWVESQRRISGQALQSMDIPRIERYITNETGIYITYIPFENFAWDRVVLSDWLLASSEETEVVGGNAPSSPYKKLTTSWAALKKPEILRRNEKRR